MKAFFFKVWCWLTGLTTYLYVVGWVYWAKSSLYRLLWERKYRDIKMGTVDRISLIPSIVAFGMKWRSDSWLELFDAVSYPQYAQEVFLGRLPVPEHGLDCDEHAIYEVNLIRESQKAGKCLEEGVTNPRFLTVIWVTPSFKPDGHNVCLLECPPETTAGFSKFRYMDYDDMQPVCESILEVARQIVAKYAPEGSALVSWGTSHEDMRPDMGQWGAKL